MLKYLNEIKEPPAEKDVLVAALNDYKRILSDHIVDYLNQLLELEFSVVRDYITEEDRSILSRIEIYRPIAFYNIQQRAMDIFNDPSFKVSVFPNGLEVCYNENDNHFQLFKFKKDRCVSYGYSYDKLLSISEEYKTMEIGDIQLFQFVDDEVARKAELNHILDELEKLYDEKNPYHSRPDVVGGPATTWAFAHFREIDMYEKEFNMLDERKELSNAEKKKIEISKKYHDLLLEDYGLTNKSFKDGAEETNLSKTYVKKMPKLEIINHIYTIY